jgi:hypothetical protein
MFRSEKRVFKALGTRPVNLNEAGVGWARIRGLDSLGVCLHEVTKKCVARHNFKTDFGSRDTIRTASVCVVRHKFWAVRHKFWAVRHKFWAVRHKRVISCKQTLEGEWRWRIKLDKKWNVSGALSCASVLYRVNQLPTVVFFLTLLF